MALHIAVRTYITIFVLILCWNLVIVTVAVSYKEACTIGTNCTDSLGDGALCGVNKTCDCQEEFAYSNKANTCLFKVETLGEDCDNNTQTCYLPDDGDNQNVECVNSTCQCQNSYVPSLDNTRCMPSKKKDDKCKSGPECTASMGNGAQCVDEKCGCQDGFKYTENNNVCAYKIQIVGEQCVGEYKICFVDVDGDNQKMLCVDGECQSVFKRAVLWDVSSKHFKDRKVSAAGWDDVCTELNINDRDLVKKKWKVLKDYYRHELIKLQKSKSGSSGENKKVSSWPYFELMGFIRNTFGLNNRPCSLVPDIELTTELEEEVGEGNEIENNVVGQTSGDSEILCESNQSQTKDWNTTNDQQSKNKPMKRKRSSAETFREAYIRNESKKLELLQKSMEDDDDDMHFLLSLLPDIKCLPRREKLLLRMEMQSLVFNTITRNEPRMVVSHTSTSASSPAEGNNDCHDSHIVPACSDGSILIEQWPPVIFEQGPR